MIPVGVAWLVSLDIAATLTMAPGPMRTSMLVPTSTPAPTPRLMSTPEAVRPVRTRPASVWRCEVAYMPARSTWVRRVEIEADDQRVTALRIDGVTPHAFTRVDTALVTALDNERIVIDLTSLQWQSDFRGLAQGQGRCELLGD